MSIDRFLIDTCADNYNSAGKELESLDRFIVVNRQGFNKILKKYKKWTGSADLTRRFHKHVLDRQTSFTSKDLSTSLVYYNQILDEIRYAGSQTTPAKASGNGNSSPRYLSPTAKRSPLSIAERLKVIFEEGVAGEVDTAFSMLPLGQESASTCYWVHPENLLQLQVLLSRHGRSRKTYTPMSTSRPSSSCISSGGSRTGLPTIEVSERSNASCLIMCDDLPVLANQWDSSTTKGSEGDDNCYLTKSVASIRLAPTEAATFAIYSSSPDRLDRGPTDFRTAKIKRNSLRRLFGGKVLSEEAGSSSQDITSPNTRCSRVDTYLNDSSDYDAVKHWLGDNTKVSPLLELHFNRCWFVGMHNSTVSGWWAALDSHVTMQKSTVSTLDRFGSSESSNDDDVAIEEFPYAILSIRLEGDTDRTLIEELANSHLVSSSSLIRFSAS